MDGITLHLLVSLKKEIMGFKDLINSIDWNKNIIMLIMYSVIIMIYTNSYLMPIIDDHKINLMEHKRSNSLENQINLNKNSVEKQLKEKLEQARDIYDWLRKDADVDSIKEYMVKKHMSHVKIQKLDNHIMNDEIEITKFQISGELAKSTDIIGLISNINEVKNSIKVSLPINIRKEANKIKVDFIIDVYHSTYNLSS